MSLPELVRYAPPVPPLQELPASRADWVLDVDRSALLVHDLQRYFVRPYAEDCPALTLALQTTARLLAAARAAGVPIFYTAQTGERGAVVRGLQGDLWGPGMQPVPEHTAVLDVVAPAEGDVILVKHRYSAFAHSDLAEQLADRGRDQLVLTGVYAHIGVTATALDAFQREVQPFLVADGVADFGPDQHRRALEQVAGCAGQVLLGDEVLAAWSPAGPVAAGGATAADTEWAREVRAALSHGVDEAFAESAFAQPDADLFTLGLNSLRAFEVLDVLADAGVDVDFGVFTRRPTLQHLLEAGATGDRVSA